MACVACRWRSTSAKSTRWRGTPGPLIAPHAKRQHAVEDIKKTIVVTTAVPFDNNRAEPEIRPAVIACNNLFHNISEGGVNMQSIRMLIYHTLKLRGLDPIETVANTMGFSIATRELLSLLNAILIENAKQKIRHNCLPLRAKQILCHYSVIWSNEAIGLWFLRGKPGMA